MENVALNCFSLFKFLPIPFLWEGREHKDLFIKQIRKVKLQFGMAIWSNELNAEKYSSLLCLPGSNYVDNTPSNIPRFPHLLSKRHESPGN